MSGRLGLRKKKGRKPAKIMTVLLGLLDGSASRLLYPLPEKNPPGRKPFLSGTLRTTSTGRNILLRLKRISFVKGIGKRLLARSQVVLADRIFPGESLFPIRFPITVVTRKEETTVSRMTLRMKPTSLPPRRRRGLSSPDSPGKGESVSCRSLFPKLFQSVRKRSQRSGPTKT